MRVHLSSRSKPKVGLSLSPTLGLSEPSRGVRLKHYSRKWFFSKGFDAEHSWEIYLVALLTRSVLAACLHARNGMGSFFFPLIANMLFVSIKLFFSWKSFLQNFSAFVNSVVYYPKLTNLHMWNICLRHPNQKFR